MEAVPAPAAPVGFPRCEYKDCDLISSGCVLRDHQHRCNKHLTWEVITDKIPRTLALREVNKPDLLDHQEFYWRWTNQWWFTIVIRPAIDHWILMTSMRPKGQHSR